MSSVANDSEPKRTFEHSCDAQASSRLLQLPLELRAKILRLLHKHSSAIKPLYFSFAADMSGPSFDGKDLSLSSQLLVTCQQLYHEASRILFQENVLRIDVNVIGRSKSHCLTVVDARISIPYNIYSDWPSDLLPLCYHWVGTSYDRGSCSRIIQIYHSLTRFAGFEVNLYYADSRSTAVVARMLADLLRHKKVVVCLERHNGDVETWVSDLLPLRFWRCQSLEFRGTDKYLEAEALGRKVELARLRQLETLIQSDEPIVDLKDEWHEFKDRFVSNGLRIDGCDYDDKFHYNCEVGNLNDAMYACDAAWFETAKIDVLKEAKKWNSRWILDQKAGIEQLSAELRKVEHRNEEIERELTETSSRSMEGASI